MLRETSMQKLTYSANKLVGLLGLSLPTVRRLIAIGTIRSIRANARVLVPKAALDHFLARR